MEAALYDGKPAPEALRIFLLAAHPEWGLGYDAVRHMRAREFALMWEIQQLVVEWSSEEGRKDVATRRSVRAAIDLEGRDLPAAYSAPFDPSTASPEAINAWLSQLS